jgi:hypothetical protein
LPSPSGWTRSASSWFDLYTKHIPKCRCFQIMLQGPAEIPAKLARCFREIPALQTEALSLVPSFVDFLWSLPLGTNSLTQWHGGAHVHPGTAESGRLWSWRSSHASITCSLYSCTHVAMEFPWNSLPWSYRKQVESTRSPRCCPTSQRRSCKLSYR